MAFVQLDVNGNVIGTFGIAQNDPTPPGYAVIDDADPRIAAFHTAIAAAQKIKPTPREWLERLSPTTQGAITAAAAKDQTGALLLWLLKAAGNPSIDVTSAETIQGVGVLAAAGIITADEQKALLTP